MREVFSFRILQQYGLDPNTGCLRQTLFALSLPEQAHRRQMIAVCHVVACLVGRAFAHLSPRAIP